MNRILIVEDDPMGATLVRRMCEEAGIKPSEFKIVDNLPEGLRLAFAEPPSLIICDLSFPQAKETAQVLESETLDFYIPRFSSIAPTGIWTGSVTPDIVERCHAAGAQFCLIKQKLAAQRCGTEILSQSVGDAILNWRREHGK